MNLIEWLAVRGNTAAGLSRLTGLKPAALSKMANEKTNVTMRSAILMDQGTKGQIKAELATNEDTGLLAYMRGCK